MLGRYFKGKNVFVTGITGFVGSHLAKRLNSLGANIYGISRSKQNKNIIKANILDYPLVDSFIRQKKIQICFHLAGESLVESGQIDPYNTYRVNIEGTLNILESARKYGMEKVIIASTSHVYGNNRVPYYEGYTPRPTRSYETSKVCTDLIAQSYRNSFHLPVLIPRFVNVYGPGDLNFTRLIPKTVKAVLANESPVMWGGDAVRDYLYITDAIDAYIQLATVNLKKVGNNCIFNFGSGLRISVENLIKEIIRISGQKIIIKRANEERETEIQAQYVSFNKAKKILGWTAKTGLEEGLRKTLTWYKNYFNA